MYHKPKIKKKIECARSALFTIEALDLTFHNQTERCYERISGRNQGAVCIAPFINAETFFLVREYAAGIDDYVLTFPKGNCDDHESWEETAQRELMEEIGYGAGRLQHLGQITVSPSYLMGKTDVVLAEDLYPKSLVGDEPEPLELVPWSLQHIHELLEHLQFHDSRSYAVLLLILKKIQRF